MNAYAQDISVGPIEVDTGNDWMDFWFVIALLIIASICYIAIKRWGK